jgi:endonuclease/exonuclease/phosphatase family metal-dependent hydrolase
MKTQLILLISVLSLKIGSCQSEQTSSPPTKLKILSWNIYMLPGIVTVKGKSQRAQAIGEVLSESDYDVIVFQEAFHQPSRKKIYRLLKDKFPYQAGPANQKLLSLKTNSGIWIFSKHPIVSTKSIIFKNRSGIDAFSRKGALLAEISFHHKRIQIAGTHLQNSGPSWIKQTQCVEFYHRILKPEFKAGVPQVICGDFNINQNNSEEYRSMLQNLNAADIELSAGLMHSYDRARNDLHVEKGTQADLIDYILVRNQGDFEVASTKIVAIRKKWCARHADLSDHFALETELQIANTNVFLSSLNNE